MKRAWTPAAMFIAGAAALGAGQAQSQSASEAVTGALRGITGLFQRSNTPPRTLPTSTIGIRGLGAEDLAQAQPDPGAVAQMEALRQDEAQARHFANQARLVPVSVPPLPSPEAATGSREPGAAR